MRVHTHTCTPEVQKVARRVEKDGQSRLACFKVSSLEGFCHIIGGVHWGLTLQSRVFSFTRSKSMQSSLASFKESKLRCFWSCCLWPKRSSSLPTRYQGTSVGCNKQVYVPIFLASIANIFMISLNQLASSSSRNRPMQPYAREMGGDREDSVQPLARNARQAQLVQLRDKWRMHADTT